MWISTTKLAKLNGVTTQTIRRRIEEGFYENTKKTDGGHYRVFIKQQRRMCYARVSSRKQASSIDTQKRILLQRYPDAEFFSDTASAFNFTRKGLQTILESAMLGHSIHVVVATKDRLASSEFELIKRLIELSGGRVEILDDDNSPSEAFDTAELIGFITSFCNSHYGKRSAQRRKDNCLKKDTVSS